VDGELSNEYYTGDTKPLVGNSTNPLLIGRRGATADDFFAGSIDEVKIYQRSLSAGEVKDHYDNSWVCRVASLPPVAKAKTPTCGDGEVDQNTEACDAGANNGKECPPGYGKTCSFCSADCRNVVFVEPKESCGDGIIQFSEVCDANPVTRLMFAAATGTETLQTKDPKGYEVLACTDPRIQEAGSFKKGTKICVNCSTILVKETNSAACVTCGRDEKNGVTVAGSVINALNPVSTDPMYSITGDTEGGYLDLYIANSYSDAPRRVAAARDPNPRYEFKETLAGTGAAAKINSNALCYQGEAPNYTMILNVDEARKYDNFEVFSQPEPWRYDLIVSPVMSVRGLKHRLSGADVNLPNSATPDTIRIVVSWTNDSEFFGGFSKPDENTPPTFEGIGGATPVTTRDYYSQPFNNFNNSWNIWYHGLGNTVGKTHIQSYTVDTARMTTNTYFFYVKTLGANFPMRTTGSAARLKVDVYFPEDTGGPIYYNLFSRPSRTFYLSRAEPSPNGQASYWQVFTIKDAVSEPDVTKRITEASYENPATKEVTHFSNGQTLTGVAQMR
ncbi:MAG TPA: LamG-like jellyroll fold domain-containing protein, partial [Patescibacteria group bacterium]|nr:LamG-like jellyroll fold domain-containing protein [Patescibacteria group bacterium]